jgi:hypothetical protein
MILLIKAIKKNTLKNIIVTITAIIFLSAGFYGQTKMPELHGSAVLKDSLLQDVSDVLDAKQSSYVVFQKNNNRHFSIEFDNLRSKVESFSIGNYPIRSGDSSSRVPYDICAGLEYTVVFKSNRTVIAKSKIKKTYYKFLNKDMFVIADLAVLDKGLSYVYQFIPESRFTFDSDSIIKHAIVRGKNYLDSCLLGFCPVKETGDLASMYRDLIEFHSYVFKFVLNQNLDENERETINSNFVFCYTNPELESISELIVLSEKEILKLISLLESNGQKQQVLAYYKCLYIKTGNAEYLNLYRERASSLFYDNHQRDK